MSQIAIRWLLQKQDVSSVIIGAKNVQQLEDNLSAADGWQLSPAEVQLAWNISLNITKIIFKLRILQCK